MIADLILIFVVRANLAASAAILIVLLLRPFARRLLGAELAYGLWLLAPVAALTTLFPNLNDFRSSPDLGSPMAYLTAPLKSVESGPLLVAWLAGAAGLLTLLVVSEWRFRRLARRGRVGPAVVGSSWPVMVVPSDYEARFTKAERDLIRAHERTHIDSRHPRDNRWIAVHLVLGWFNPLIHLAARCARLDQELACDAIVVATRSKQKRLYAETLLKGARVAGPWSALACALTEGGRHPLEVRLGALSRNPVTFRQFMLGAAVVAALAVGSALSVWTLAPQTFGVGANRAEPYVTEAFSRSG